MDRLSNDYPWLLKKIPILVAVSGTKSFKLSSSFKPSLIVSFSPKEISTLPRKLAFLERKIKKEPKKEGKNKLIIVGASTGGPRLIEKILVSLPEDYPHSLCIVQHFPKGFSKRFAERLNSISKLEVLEAEEGMELIPGRAVIAKAGYHLHLQQNREKIVCKIVPNIKGLFFVPSVDETFFSALSVIGSKDVVAVLLTGIGYDGAEGMVALRKAGAFTIAESEKTAAVYGMPKVAKEKGGAVKVLDFPDIQKFIFELGES
ncbi:CheB methylesterase domain-containing protein [Thermovibrio guaymasensis]|nr:CheB methylesterase domain-containing protein [Thermovibrio guaymasensis]